MKKMKPTPIKIIKEEQPTNIDPYEFKKQDLNATQRFYILNKEMKKWKN